MADLFLINLNSEYKKRRHFDDEVSWKFLGNKGKDLINKLFTTASLLASSVNVLEGSQKFLF
jgi:hypothetical protein